MQMITRAEWGARPPTRRTPLSTPVRRVVIHHGAGSSADPLRQWRAYQRVHMGIRGWSDIAYNFGIGAGGEVLEGRGADHVGGATGAPHDATSISVCFVGNFETERPTAAAIAACVDLLASLHRSGHVTRDFQLVGHRDAGQTACPGRNLYGRLDEIRGRALDAINGDDMPTLDAMEQLRRAFNRGDRAAVKTVQDYLRAGGFRPGRSDGVVGDRTRAALEAAGVGGDPTRLGPAGFGRVVAAGLGVDIDRGPQPDCADAIATAALQRARADHLDEILGEVRRVVG